MNSKVKALIWEECRVGGVISLWCWVMASIVMLVFRFIAEEVRVEGSFLGVTVYGVPFMIAALLILNPNHKGVLVGGFSQRILQLPVATFIPVAITLLARTCFVFIGTLLTVWVSILLFTDTPGIDLAMMVSVLYLIVQLLDWMRKPISGLTSVLLIGGVSTLIFLAWSDVYSAQGLFKVMIQRVAYANDGILIFSAIVIVLLTYLPSVLFVHLTRIGRQYGIPEVWTWHQLVDVGNGKDLKPFSSVFRAQMWVEVRRSLYFLPIITVIIPLIIYSLMYLANDAGEGLSWNNRNILSIIILIGVLVGAMFHGAKTGILGFRNTKGMPGYTYLHPLSTEGYAYAKVMANAWLLFPCLFLAGLLHFTLPGTVFFGDYVSVALAKGMTSYNEVAWVLLSRVLFIGLCAWMVMAISTRLFLKLLAGVLLIPIGLVILFLVQHGNDFGANNGQTFIINDFILVYGLFLIIINVGGYLKIWKQGIVSTRSIVFWGVVWMLLGGLIFSRSSDRVTLLNFNAFAHFRLLVTSLSLSSFATLPFLAFVLDIRKKRHSATPVQFPKHYIPVFRWREASGQARSSMVVGAVVGLSFLWLSVPSTPSYVHYKTEQGLPSNLDELNAWYTSVPDEQNIALLYKEQMGLLGSKSAQYDQRIMDANTHDESIAQNQSRPLASLRGGMGKNPAADFLNNDVNQRFIVGGASVGRNEPVPQNIWDVTNAYWGGVTQHVAPLLNEWALAESMGSRYLIDMRGGFSVELPHLAGLRAVSRELVVDALHWGQLGEHEKAVDSLLAIIPVANSLENEPILISMFVRIACVGIVVGNTEWLLNHVELNDAALIRLQKGFEKQSLRLRESMVLNRPFIGEQVIGLSVSGSFLYIQPNSELESRVASMIPLQQFSIPVESEHIVSQVIFDRMTICEDNHWVRYLEEMGNEKGYASLSYIAPMSMILLPDIGRSNEPQFRIITQLDCAATAIAVERFRLENGELPDSLDDLVPVYLDQVPVDGFSAVGEPINYRIQEDGEFVVYSIGRDLEDDLGEELERWAHDGDYTFTLPIEKVPWLGPAQVDEKDNQDD